MKVYKPDVLGRILDEPHVNWYILAESAKHGGLKPVEGYDDYYVFIVKYNAPESVLRNYPEYWQGGLGYDDYFLSWEEVERFLDRYEIEWLEGEEIFFGHRYYFKNNPMS